MKTTRLDEGEIATAMKGAPDWEREVDGDAIKRSFRFRGFTHAMAFMNEVAEIAEKMNHHPEWSNVYNRVDIRLTTHSCGSLSRLDFDLAARIDEITRNYD